jgi:adenylate cyclase
VLFVDIVGSTELAERHAPGSVGELLDEFFAMCTDCIFHHRGNLNNFIGDAVMAVFGAPLSISNHETAAVRTAMDILRGMEALNRTRAREDEFRLRIGVNSGTALAGDMGPPQKKHFTVLGDPVNVASRLTGMEPPNQIYIGPATRANLDREIAVDDLGMVAMKGKSTELNVFRVVLP